MNNSRHIGTKDTFVEDIKLDEFFKDSKKFESFNDKIKQKSIIEKFLVKKLGYNSFNRGAPLMDRNGKEATIKGIISDIEEILQLNSDFRIDLALCEAFKEYIDFEHTNINVEVPIEISQEKQEFLKKLQNCPKVIKVGYGIEDTPKNSKNWIKGANIAYVIDIDGEEIDSSIEEILEKYNAFKRYSEEEQKYDTPYEYFIKQKIDIYSMQIFGEIEQIENWRTQNGGDNEKIELLFHPDSNNVKDYINAYHKLSEKNNKYCAEISMNSLRLERDSENEVLFRNLNKKQLEQMRQYEKMGIKFIPETNDKICLCVDTIAEVDESIWDQYNIQYITIGRNENSSENPLTISKYRKIRKILDEVVEGIDINESEENKVKEVYTRLANMLTYDNEAAEDNTKYAEDNVDTSRNLENGLLYGKCVCAGYVEILRQALSLVGIESHYMKSQKNADGDSHAYNIIKINGNWYNADLTWDYENIRKKIRPKYFLKSDQDFTKLDEDEKNLHIPANKEYVCSSKTMNLYKEYKKDNAVKKFFNDAKEAFEEIGPKQAMHNLVRNVGKIIKSKLTQKKKLLPEATGVVASKIKKEKSFKEELKEGAPTIEEQAYSQQVNNEFEMNLNNIEMEENEK